MNSQKVTNKFLKQLTTVRQKKILRLRSKIVSGKYRISNEALAKALFLAQ
jgi:anti-sigma28 factor (negative regulator of flagellin synthesis)